MVFSKKIRNATNKGFIFNKIVILTIKIDSSRSNTNKCYYLNLPIPIMHREFLRKLYQNPKDVKTNCNDLYKLVRCASRRWILYTQSLYNCT